MATAHHPRQLVMAEPDATTGKKSVHCQKQVYLHSRYKSSAVVRPSTTYPIMEISSFKGQFGPRSDSERRELLSPDAELQRAWTRALGSCQSSHGWMVQRANLYIHIDVSGGPESGEGWVCLRESLRSTVCVIPRSFVATTPIDRAG